MACTKVQTKQSSSQMNTLARAYVEWGVADVAGGGGWRRRVREAPVMLGRNAGGADEGVIVRLEAVAVGDGFVAEAAGGDGDWRREDGEEDDESEHGAAASDSPRPLRHRSHRHLRFAVASPLRRRRLGFAVATLLSQPPPHRPPPPTLSPRPGGLVPTHRPAC